VGFVNELTVVFVAFDGVQPIDVAGPHEVFANAGDAAASLGRRGGYRVRVASPRGGLVRSESGLELGTVPLPGPGERIASGSRRHAPTSRPATTPSTWWPNAAGWAAPSPCGAYSTATSGSAPTPTGGGSARPLITKEHPYDRPAAYRHPVVSLVHRA
jgi:putative intracellular protease/amidase